MTEKEFDEVLNYLYAALPGMLKHVEQSPDVAVTQGIWYRGLKDFSADECKDAISDIASGKGEFNVYERDKIAGVLRQRILSRRPPSEAKHQPGRNKYRRNYTGSDMAVAFVKMCQLQDQRADIGEDEYNRRHKLVCDSLVSKHDMHARVRDFACATCEDTGLVQCIHPNEYRTIREGKGLNEPMDVCMFRCVCEKGETLPTGNRPFEQFSGSRHIKVQSRWLSQSEQDNAKLVVGSSPVGDFAAWS